jgi:hypothetical protein
LRYPIGWEWQAAVEVLREGPLSAKVGIEVTALAERRANEAARQMAMWRTSTPVRDGADRSIAC